MQVYAIISEYNPFHNGHQLHIEAARRDGATHIVAIMGGNFLQRGDCALLDKHRRARAALAGGADLVVELPLPYACATAERFAFGGVSLADGLGCVSHLSFGSECGSTQLLLSAAKAVDDPAVNDRMRALLAEGMTFARARQQAVAQCICPQVGQVLAQPNNTLGVEYTRALLRRGSDIGIHTIQRQGAGHNSSAPVGSIASASYVRGLVKSNDSTFTRFLPEASAQEVALAIAEGASPADLQHLERAILLKLRGMTHSELAALPDISEGLEHRLFAAARSATSLEELLMALKTKRYPLSRLRRMVLCALLGVQADLCRLPPPYIRVLGFNDRGREVLSLSGKIAQLPVSHSLARLEELGGNAARFARLEAYAGDVFALLTPRAQPCGAEYRAKLVRVP